MERGMHHIRVTPHKGMISVTKHAFPSDHKGMGNGKHFGVEEGDKALAHIARLVGIPGAAEEAGEPEHKKLISPVEVE